MRRTVPALVLAAVLAASTALLMPVVLPGAPAPAVLTSADRAAIAHPGVGRGTELPLPAVLPSGPDAVARAYLRAAHGGEPADAGHSRRAAVVHAVPGGPAAAGAPVLDPPGAGERRIAEVDALEPAGSDAVRGRIAFVARVRTTTGAPGSAPRTAQWRTRVVLHRTPDGRWLVAADVPITPDTPDVDD